MRTFKFLLPLFAVLCLFACTPKTSETVTETKPTKPAGPKPCATFEDAPNPDLSLEQFVLYRDFLREKDWDTAFDYWKKVYKNAPNADGKRGTVYNDGVRFYEHFIETDPTQKDVYIKEVFKIYDKMEECYPDGGYAKATKGFAYFFNYPDLATKEEQYQLLKESIDLDGGEPRYFIINPMTSLLVDLALEEKIPVGEAKRYSRIILDAIEKGLAECEGEACESWNIINEYAPARLEALEAIQDFYDCEYYKTKYFPVFKATPDDCETITTVYSRLRWGGCDVDGAELQEINAAYEKNCKQGTTTTISCNDLLRDADYRGAIDCLENRIETLSDSKDKALYKLLIAKIYYAHLKNYPKARQYAEQAADLRGGWGEPYLLIGTLYASSGPLCGPGRGWDSQIVTWPAIDMWQKARSIDGSVAGKANKLINQYEQYMPSKGDIFQRGIKEGDPFRVGCWIQRNTTVRAAP